MDPDQPQDPAPWEEKLKGKKIVDESEIDTKEVSTKVGVLLLPFSFETRKRLVLPLVWAEIVANLDN